MAQVKTLRSRGSVTPLETPGEAKERKRGASRGHLTGVEGPRRLNPGPRCPPSGSLPPHSPASVRRWGHAEAERMGSATRGERVPEPPRGRDTQSPGPAVPHSVLCPSRQRRREPRRRNILPVREAPQRPSLNDTTGFGYRKPQYHVTPKTTGIPSCHQKSGHRPQLR